MRRAVTATPKVTRGDLAASLSALARVAERVDPFDFVPRANVTARIVTMGPFHLREAEFAAVMETSGARFAFLANLAPEGEVGDGPAWRVPRTYPFEELKSDADWDGIGQSVLWGADGSWLVTVSNEGHGIIAGQRGFVDEVERRLPHRGDDLAEIIDRLLGRRPETVDADARLMAMVARLHGADEERRIRDDLGDDIS